MRKLTTLVGLVALLLAGIASADDITTKVLGTGSATGTVTAASPAASGIGKWIQVTGGKDDTTFLTFQVSAMGTNVIRIEASLDGTNADVPYTFAADKEIYRIEVCGGCVYRAVCGTFTSGSPIVTASASGKGQITVLQ